MVRDDTLVIVLAGGAGERLAPLTRDRAKPAVYFGGPYRIIDFVLSNCVNSGLRRVFIATQYKSLSLNRHIRMGWNIVSEELGEFIEILPPQKRVGEHWYLGTADAVYQNLYSIEREAPRHVVVLAGDHVYKMDYRKMLRAHDEHGADVTMATIEVPVDDATRFGVVAVDGDRRVVGFQEKPASPTPMPGLPHLALASMGIYVFDMDVLVEGARGRRRRSRQPPRLRQEHPAAAHRPRAASSPIPSTTRTRRRRSTGATSARSTPTTRPTWTSATSTPTSTSTIRSGRCAPTSRRRRRPSSSSPTTRRMGTALDSVISPGCIVSGSRIQRQHPVPQRPGAQLRDDRELDPDAGRAGRPARADPQRHHRPRRAGAARRGDRPRPRRGSPAAHRDRTRHRRGDGGRGRAGGADCRRRPGVEAGVDRA